MGVLRGAGRFAAVTLGVVALDQATKLAVRWTVPAGYRVQLVGGWVQITHVRNPGAAFGLFSGQVEWLVALTLVVVGSVLLSLPRLRGLGGAARWGLSMGLGGATGNLIDRLVAGRVTDFIELASLPVFNLADVAIVSGMGLLFWEIWKGSGGSPVEGREEAP